MLNPKVSVVVSTYNREKYLKYTIDSVLNQSLEDFEILIIDDGSTDGTANLVKSYSDERIRYIYQENSGQNSARNKGIRFARGEYITLLDSDDMFLPENLEKQSNVLDNHQEYGMVYCGTLLIDEHNNLIGQKPLIKYNGYVLDKLLMTNFLFNGSSCMFRRECIDKVGLFDTSIKRMTDWEFYLRFAIYYRFASSKEYLLEYRVHPDTMSFNFRDYETCGFNILDKIFSHEDINSYYLNFKNKAYAMRYKYLAMRCIENGCMDEAREYISKAVNSDFSVLFSSSIPKLALLSFLPVDLLFRLKLIKKTVKTHVIKIFRQNRAQINTD